MLTWLLLLILRLDHTTVLQQAGDLARAIVQPLAAPLVPRNMAQKPAATLPIVQKHSAASSDIENRALLYARRVYKRFAQSPSVLSDLIREMENVAAQVKDGNNL